MPAIAPGSPEAKGIGKFGDVPVGTYTGTPDISMPIYTIKAGKLSLPITLSYHATGIEVSQEATWVGLGWNMVAGGTISYIPVGGNDQSSSGINPDAFLGLFNYLGVSGYPGFRQEDKFVGWGCFHPEQESSIITTEMMGPLQGGFEQQDVYSANFLNYSFKFIKHPINGLYFFMGQKNKCLISGGGLNGFVITGEDGTVYQFGSIEKNLYPTSWLLTKMISSTGDTITLKYKSVITYNLPALSESYTKKEKGTLPSRTFSGSSSNYVMYLDTIETRNELIVFESDTNRNDLTGAYRLTRVTIKDRVSQIEKFSYRFAYGYFIGSNVGGDYLNDNQDSFDQSVIIRKNRLRLDSLIQVSNTLANEKYAFSYYDSVPLPRKTSFAMDYWGYYNGQENSSNLIDGKKHTIIPRVLPLITGNPLDYGKVIDSFYPLNGATRGASKDIAIASAGMLKSIQYPTKGKTVFTYEPHDFSNYKYYSLEDAPLYQVFPVEESVTVTAWGTNPPYPVTNITRDTFKLTQQADVYLTGYSNLSDGWLGIEGINVPGGFSTMYISISDPYPQFPHLKEWNNKKISLNPGTYALTLGSITPLPAQGDGMYPKIWGSLVYGQHYYYYSDTSASGHVVGGLGGGLRVKTVVSYDENNKVVSSKKYSYVDENGNSSGKLLIPLQNLDLRDKVVGRVAGEYGWYDKYTSCTLYGSSYVSLSGYLTGNNVGYDRVVVETYNNSGVTNGKEISYYDNSPGSLIFGKIPFFTGANNGSLLKKITLNTNGDTLLLEKNNYIIWPGTETTETLNAFAEDLYEGETGICEATSGNTLAYVGRYNIYAYQTRNYWNSLVSKETTHYFPSGKVKETSNYTYNPENLCIKSSSFSTSIDNTNKIIEYNYPFNYTDEPYTTMVLQKNIVNPVIEQIEKVNTTFLQSTKTNYKDWFSDQKIIAPENVVTTNGTSAADIRARYKYDRWGNIIEASKENDVRTCYLWGYNNSFPVVKIEGKAEADVSQTLKDLIAKHVFSCKADYTSINSDMNWLKTQLSSMLIDKACFVSFFTYDPVFGLTSSTGPDGVTMYYEYDTFGRLQYIKDDDGRILKSFEYHYKP